MCVANTGDINRIVLTILQVLRTTLHKSSEVDSVLSAPSVLSPLARGPRDGPWLRFVFPGKCVSGTTLGARSAPPPPPPPPPVLHKYCYSVRALLAPAPVASLSAAVLAPLVCMNAGRGGNKGRGGGEEKGSQEETSNDDDYNYNYNYFLHTAKTSSLLLSPVACSFKCLDRAAGVDQCRAGGGGLDTQQVSAPEVVLHYSALIGASVCCWFSPVSWRTSSPW